MKSKKIFYLKSFTLNELLVVLIIIGILVLIALPSLLPLISNAKATEAKLQLNHAYTLQESYFLANSHYTSSFQDLGFEQQKLKKDGGNAVYIIRIESATDKTFTIKAEATEDFDKDGTYNVWEINQEKKLREVVKD